MIPYTSSWYRDYRGALDFKIVTGDFAITAEIRTTGRDGQSIPGIEGQFSLGGLMIRTPRDITPDDWQPGGENYVFLSIGYGARNPAGMQYEVKTTQDGDSQLQLSDAPDNHATLQLARIGPAVIALRQDPGADWVIHRRFSRDDLPEELQVGMVSYTDWRKCGQFDPFVHNGTVLSPPLPDGVEDPDPSTPFVPDLIATYSYARFARPQVPEELEGLDLTDPNEVPDAWLLAFLGEPANRPAYATGDVNCDESIDFADIDAFVLALIDRNDFESAFPECDWYTADVDRDGEVTFADIDGFVACIVNGECP
jgi:hypothetical protein